MTAEAHERQHDANQHELELRVVTRVVCRNAVN